MMSGIVTLSKMTLRRRMTQTRTNAGRRRFLNASRRYPGATINLQCPKLTRTTSDAYYLVNLCSHQFWHCLPIQQFSRSMLIYSPDKAIQ